MLTSGPKNDTQQIANEKLGANILTKLRKSRMLRKPYGRIYDGSLKARCYPIKGWLYKCLGRFSFDLICLAVSVWKLKFTLISSRKPLLPTFACFLRALTLPVDGVYVFFPFHHDIRIHQLFQAPNRIQFVATNTFSGSISTWTCMSQILWVNKYTEKQDDGEKELGNEIQSGKFMATRQF